MKSRSRKAMGVTATMGVIAGAVVGLVSIGISYGFIMDIAGGNAPVQQDADEIEQVVSVAQSKCRAATECVETEQSTVSVDLSAAQSVDIHGEPPEQELSVEFPDESRTWTLNYCNYNIDSEDLTQSSTWDFSVSAEFGDPPTVSIESGQEGAGS